MVRAEIAGPWARFARAFILTSSPDGPRFVPPALEVDPIEAKKNGIVFGIEAADFAASDRPADGRAEGRLRNEGEAAAWRKNGPLRRGPLPPVLLPRPRRGSPCGPDKRDRTVRSRPRAARPVGGGGARVGADRPPGARIWTQDATEIGHVTDGARSSAPPFTATAAGRSMPSSPKIPLGRDFGLLRKGGFAAAPRNGSIGRQPRGQPSREGEGSREFPNGRAYAGTQGVRAMHPDVIKFLEAQGAQAPVLWLDTSWLVIGHVDETVSWVPSKVGTPFRMLVPSPRLAVEILARRAGGPRRDLEPGDNARATPVKSNGRSPRHWRIKACWRPRSSHRQRSTGSAKASGGARGGGGRHHRDPRPVRSNPPTGSRAAVSPRPPTWSTPPPRERLDRARSARSAGRGQGCPAPGRQRPARALGCRVLALDCFYPYHRGGGEIHCGTNATRLP